jgi:hypothetical protein
MIRDVPFKVSFDLKLKANANIKILKKRIFFGLNSPEKWTLIIWSLVKK